MLNGRRLERVTAIRDLTGSRDSIEVCRHAQSCTPYLRAGRVGSSTGHVLTRIVQKGAEALGILKEYDRELEVLEALLNQRRWRRGRRGKWYERRALVLTRYCDKCPETLGRAVRGLLDSLNDRDTHLGEWPRRPPELKPIVTHVVYRPSLSRRLSALEKKMGISPEERHPDDPLAVTKEVYITGVRLRNAPAAVDRKPMAQEPPLDMPTKAVQSVLPFPVVKAALRAKRVAMPPIGALGSRVRRVRMIL